ncbi:MAG: glycosyltransferase family 4 protein, partial [Frankia sp.]|nr:glycosyltransferase family 4 protein [Frankia sp.]
MLATSTGGTGAHVRSLLDELQRSGSDVTVYGPPATDARFGFSAAGADFAALPLAAGVRPVATIRARRALARAGRADIVHAHGLRAAVAAAGLARRTRLVITWHNAPPPARGRAAVFRVLMRYAARRADANLCVSRDLVALVARGGVTARLAPVGAAPLPPPYRSRDDVRAEVGAGTRALVVAVGRLQPQKGFDVLVDAAGRWRTAAAAPVTVVAGDGPDRETLQRQALRVGADVRFVGHRTDVSELLRAADIVVMSSQWEGSPLAAHEALLAGAPLVATA